MLRLLALAALLGSAACIVPSPPIVAGERASVGLRGAWTPAERAELAAACDDWRAWTAGRLDARIDPDATDPDGWIVRAELGPPFARLSAAERTIKLDPDGLAAEGWPLGEGLGALARNALGRAAGIGQHDGSGVLSRHDVTRDWTAADQASCRDAGFCD